MLFICRNLVLILYFENINGVKRCKGLLFLFCLILLVGDCLLVYFFDLILFLCSEGFMDCENF